jgi:hypothetical protein
MLLKEAASAEICALVKAHGTSSSDKYEIDADLITARLLESGGTGSEFSAWFWNYFGNNVRSRNLHNGVTLYWRNYLSSQYVI